MTFELHVDAARWLTHLDSVSETTEGLVPVVKGNGYGLGRDVLAAQTTRLGLPRLAVGTYAEVQQTLVDFAGDVLVLSPYRPFLPDVILDERVVHTVGRVEDVAELAARAPGTRVVVEGETSMSRHGLDRHELAAAADALTDLVVDGFAVHLPMTGSNLAEAERWAAVLETSRIDTDVLYVSHLTPAELAVLRERRPNLTVRPRIGTSLWLGDLGAFDVRATVLDVHGVARGERVGYRQRPVPRDGHVLVISGGTSHGIGLEAPRAQTTVLARGKTLAKGGLEAGGLSLSPFTIGGRQRWFVEPPHMQASMVLLPASVPPPAVGETVSAAVRYTTTTFDRIVVE